MRIATVLSLLWLTAKQLLVKYIRIGWAYKTEPKAGSNLPNPLVLLILIFLTHSSNPY